MSRLGKRDREIIHECLVAAAYGPFFPDWEFPILFGLTREQARSFADQWPESAEDAHAYRAVLNSLNNLAGYPIDHIDR